MKIAENSTPIVIMHERNFMSPPSRHEASGSGQQTSGRAARYFHFTCTFAAALKSNWAAGHGRKRKSGVGCGAGHVRWGQRESAVLLFKFGRIIRDYPQSPGRWPNE